MKKWRQKFPEVERRNIVKAAKQSLRNPEGREALQYLKEERRLTDSIIDRFDMGYCPPEIGHEVSGRIITPIYDVYRNIIALSTRHLDKSHPQRFWHESFDKGCYLYGLCYAKDRIRETKKAIVVEGELDVAPLHVDGFDMTVGVCGKVLTLFQISLLLRYCSEFYIMFDGDSAGKEAIKKALEIYEEYDSVFKEYGIKFIPVYLPNGLDPDDFLKRYGKIKMREKLIAAKEDYILFSGGNN